MLRRFASLIACLTLFTLGLALPDPGIKSPRPGAHIQPKETFAFEYRPMFEFGVTTYGYAVWMFTKMPQSFESSPAWGAAHYFGRFIPANWPGVNNPPESVRPPKTLVMPDLRDTWAGWATGGYVTNAKFYFAVLEEYGVRNASFFFISLATFSFSYLQGSVGHKLAFFKIPIFYNTTAY